MADENKETKEENTTTDASAENTTVDTTTDTPPNTTDEVDYKAQFEAAKAEKEALLSKNSELLGKLKGTKDQLSEIEAAKAEKIKTEAEESGQFEKLVDILKEEKASLKAQIDERETTEQTRREGLLMDAKKARFLKELGNPEFHDPSVALDQVDWDKFVMEDEGFNKDGVKQAVEAFRASKSYLIKSSDAEVNSRAAEGSKQSKDDYRDYLRAMAEGD